MALKIVEPATYRSSSLVATRSPAPNQMEMALQSWQSWDYYNSRPYPAHAFGPRQWAADKGPPPTALPYVQIAVDDSASFLFRNGSPHFSVVDNPEADAFLQSIIHWNRLDELWIPRAISAGNQGAIAAKFSVDMDDPLVPVRINFLEIPQQCRVWIDPHDRTRVLMARIQYPYRDSQTGEWFFFREEWTETEHITFYPRPAGPASVSHPMLLTGYASSLGDEGEWIIEDEVVNDFGLIPITVIRNRAAQGNPLGEGDCWRVFRLIDRIALTMHGEDRTSQLHSQPQIAVKNANLDSEGPLQPGEPLVVMSESPDMPADIALLEPHGRARQWTHETISKWQTLLYKAVGLSEVDPANVSNKGELTELAFSIIFERTISTSDRKRELWGKSGMSVFFRDVLRALVRLGGVKELSVKNEDDIAVDVKWPPYFDQSDQDRKVLTDRTILQLQAGLVPPDVAIRRIARSEGIGEGEIDKMIRSIARRRTTTTKSKEPSATTRASSPVIDQTELANIRDASGSNNFTG